MTNSPTGARTPGAGNRPGAGPSVLPGGGGWLRIALGLACTLTMVTVFVHGHPSGTNLVQWVVMVALTWWVVARPGSGGPSVMLIGALVLRILLGRPELDLQLIALVVLLPLVHQLSALSAVIPLRSDVRWAAVVPTLLRYFGAVFATVLGLLLSRWLGWW